MPERSTCSRGPAAHGRSRPILKRRPRRGRGSVWIFRGAQLRRQHAGRRRFRRPDGSGRTINAPHDTRANGFRRALRLHAPERRMEPAGVHQRLQERAERRVRLCHRDQRRREHHRGRRGRRSLPDAGHRSSRVRQRLAAPAGREHLGRRGVRVRPGAAPPGRSRRSSRRTTRGRTTRSASGWR